MNVPVSISLENVLILAPRGRDATVARDILAEAGINSSICNDLSELLYHLESGSDAALVTEEALRGDWRELSHWIDSQPPWSDFPFIIITQHGGGIERNPEAANLTSTFGNVSFLERPFHPTTLVSVVETNLRGRRRQYECRRLNDELELRVHERTTELATANGQLLAQIEERERMEMTLRQMQRLEAVGQLTSGVAHDFNNLLTVVLGNISFLEKQFAQNGIDGNMSRRLGYMRAAAERGAKLTDQLLSFSRRQRLEPKVLDLSGSVAGMHDLMRSTIGGTVHIKTRLTPKLWPALVDPTQLELAVLNLAINARDALGAGGTIEVSTANVTLGHPQAPEEPAPGEYVEVCVRDDGSGMPDDVRSKVFEPFFTTKEIGKGSGLGLSQVLGFAKQSGGGVRIESAPGSGTSVHIYLPRTTAELTPNESTSELVLKSDHHGARIVLVDDDSAVRDVTAAMLRELGYEVLEVSSGGAALELLETTSTCNLCIIDFAMPGMNGAELAHHVRAKRPAMPVLFITGFAERTALNSVNDSQIVSKPFVTGELAEKVRLALRASPAH